MPTALRQVPEAGMHLHRLNRAAHRAVQIGMEFKVLMVFVFAVDEANRDPWGIRSFRHLLRQVAL